MADASMSQSSVEPIELPSQITAKSVLPAATLPASIPSTFESPSRNPLTARKRRNKISARSRHGSLDQSETPDGLSTIRSPSLNFTFREGSSTMATRPVRFLIASLGNPAPYQNTRHSAGHILLKYLAPKLSLPSPSRSSEVYHGNVTSGSDYGRPEYTLWQSTSLMNVSGANLSKAWKLFSPTEGSRSDDESAASALVVLHDELETPLGQLKIRRGEGSAKGHNGIKSVQASLSGSGMLHKLGNRFIKVGIGIGRPVSRERDDVSRYVLGELTTNEREKIEKAAEELESVLIKELERIGKS